jgi:hypothetical protein
MELLMFGSQGSKAFFFLQLYVHRRAKMVEHGRHRALCYAGDVRVTGRLSNAPKFLNVPPIQIATIALRAPNTWLRPDC